MAATVIVYEGRNFRVEQRDVRGRDGKERRYDLVVHPGAAVVLPILNDGRVVLISNHRFAVGQDLLELPAGTLDPPEPALECARRELVEETGYRAGKLEPLLSFYSTPGICTERMHAFVATELVLGERALDPGERIENTPMEYGEALRAIGDGRITDAKTIVTLLYYDRYVRERG
ncbi:MAG: NUDIX hydrolase [Phycisphaerae bacterium]